MKVVIQVDSYKFNRFDILELIRCARMSILGKSLVWLLVIQILVGPGTVWSQGRGGKSGGTAGPGGSASSGGGSSRATPDGRGGGGGVSALAPAEESLPGGQALSRAVIPDQYILGPGDALTINLWGEYDEKYEVKVTPDGKISIPTIGTLRLKGLSLTEAEMLIGAEVKRFYRNVKSSVSLTSLRVFEVLVLGEVEKPGRYLGTPVKRVSDAITQAGGVVPGGSQRFIEVRRGGQVAATADLIAFLRRGDEGVNPFLQDGDVIFVPPLGANRIVIYVTSVTTASGVGGSMAENTIPNVVEVKEGEHLAGLLSEVGGISPWWDLEGIIVQRPSQFPEGTMRIPVDLRRYYMGKDESQNVVLQSGDQIYIPANVQRVFVAGAVKIGGAFNYQPGRAAEAYLAQAGGMALTADLSRSYIQRADGAIEPYNGMTELNNGDSIVVLEKLFKTWQDYFALVGTITGVVLSVVGFYGALTGFGR